MRRHAGRVRSAARSSSLRSLSILSLCAQASTNVGTTTTLRTRTMPLRGTPRSGTRPPMHPSHETRGTKRSDHRNGPDRGGAGSGATSTIFTPSGTTPSKLIACHSTRPQVRHANASRGADPCAEFGPSRSPKPEHGDHRNRSMAITETGAWRSPKPGIPITETGDGDRLISVVRPLPDLR